MSVLVADSKSDSSTDQGNGKLGISPQHALMEKTHRYVTIFRRTSNCYKVEIHFAGKRNFKVVDSL